MSDLKIDVLSEMQGLKDKACELENKYARLAQISSDPECRIIYRSLSNMYLNIEVFVRDRISRLKSELEAGDDQ